MVSFSSTMNFKKPVMDFHWRMAFTWEKINSGCFLKAYGLIGLGVFQISTCCSTKCPLTFIFSTWDALTSRKAG